MPIQSFRRGAAIAVAALTLAACAPTVDTAAPATTSTTSPVVHDTEFGALERTFDARLGVYAIDTGTGKQVEYRPDDRFAFASTFKALAAGAVLRANTVAELEEVVPFEKTDLVPNSPIATQHVGTGMTLRAACDAAIRYSDNTAGNLLLKELGGPNGFTAAMRDIGDRTLRSDRFEIELNEAVPGDPRDTSTPRALATSLRTLTLGDAMPENKRTILIDMLRANTTGAELIRAGTPAGWVVGDKTGGGKYGTRNDIAVIWPPNRAPIVLAILSSRTTSDATYDEALIAEATKVTIGGLS
ncbi:MAG: class A beta-lactamase [Actinomycetota bacterium]|nr:class A beta-lactamase [Actinomycetota bacterium]